MDCRDHIARRVRSTEDGLPAAKQNRSDLFYTKPSIYFLTDASFLEERIYATASVLPVS
jgi:hypothetical protein